MRLNNFARKKLIVLLAGVVCAIVLIAAWSVIYKRVHPDFLNTNAAVARTQAAIQLSQGLSGKPTKRALQELSGRGLHLTLIDQSAPNDTAVYTFDKNSLRTHLQTHASIAILLSSGKWLQVKRNTTVANNLVTLMYALLALIMLVLIVFCYWVVASLQFPVHELSQAAKRFTRDMNAPPLAETGPVEYKAAIAAFNDMQSRLRQLIFDRTQMLTAISHDLQTPITRLQLRSEALSDKELKHKMHNDLEDMSCMIDSILSFARDYRENEAVQAFDLDALLATICNDFADSGHDVQFTAQNKIAISGRMLALKRVFSNLIDNAIKYANAAEISWQLNEDTVTISIADNGPGIAESEINKVFQPFYRVDKSRSLQVSGSGLGLSVAADIIRAHGGDIRLNNRQPQGLLVSVELPLDKTK